MIDGEISPHVLVRVAGFPWSALAPLRCEETASIAGRLDLVEDELASRRDARCARIHQRIHGEEDPGLRRALLGLKRSIFNGRSRGGDALPADVRRALEVDPSLLGEVLAWEAAVAAVARLRAQGERALQAEGRAMRRGLRALFQDPLLGTAVLFSQPRLFQSLTRLPDDAGGPADRETAQLERTLLAYCHRMATKTSPFSTFTWVGVGRIEPAPVAGALPSGARRSSTFVLGASIVRALGSRLLADPAIRESLPVRLNATAELDGDEIHFLHCRPAVGGAGPPKESLVSFQRAPIIDLLFRALQGSRERLTATAIVEQLSRGLSLPPEPTARFLEELLRVGLLEVSLEYDANDEAALHGLREALPPALTLLRGDIGEAQSIVDGLAAAAPAEQAAGLTRLRSTLSGIARGLGDAEGSLEAESLVHQSCFLSDRIPIPEETFAPLRDALLRIGRVLWLFNHDLPFQGLVTEAFLDRHGRDGCAESPLALFRELCRRTPDADNPFLDLAARVPSAREAKGLATRLLDELRAQIAASDGRAVELPGALRALGSHGAALRPARDPGERGHDGAARGAHGRAVRAVRAAVRAQQGLRRLRDDPGAVGLPGRGAVGAWLARVVDPRVALAAGGRRGAGRAGGHVRLRWTGEAAAHGSLPALSGRGGGALPRRRHSLELARRRLCRGLAEAGARREEHRTPDLPLHFGTLSPAYFPPFYRFLTCFGPCFSPDLPLLDLLEERLPAPAPDAVRHYPRISHDGIVLMRETWCIPAAQIPRGSGPSIDFSHFVDVRRWARALGAGRFGYVTPMRTADILRRRGGEEVFRRLHKPFFVDWDDVGLHLLFQRFTRASEATLVLTEALPSPEEAPGTRRGELRVTEHVLELHWS